MHFQEKVARSKEKGGIEVAPQSSFSKNCVAVFQLGYSAFQVFCSDWSTIRRDGLSSPYVAVIPYVLMSVVNLTVNTLVPTYAHVTILRYKGQCECRKLVACVGIVYSGT